MPWDPFDHEESAVLAEQRPLRDVPDASWGSRSKDRPVHLYRAVSEAMTVHETNFFRDRTTFDALRDHILPKLIERRRSSRRLRIWSAACSTGQEAYSVAMLLREHLPQREDWDIRIMGTDISQQTVEYASEGTYSRPEVNCGLPVRMLLRYMTRSEEQWQINPDLRAMCDFQRRNLCVSTAGLPLFDLILLRNVLFYLDSECRTSLLTAAHHHLAEDGFLVLGEIEQAEDVTDLFQPNDSAASLFYRPRKIV